MAYQYRKKLFDPKSEEPFRLSRSKIDLFTECPRCFYLDRRLGIERPRGPAFTLNVAVDHLLKKEFDLHRANKTTHPLMKKYGIDAVPLNHKDMDKWRENFVGIQFVHVPTNLLITGAVDDVWVNPKNELIVVDYKATAKEGKMERLSDTRWENQYKRQMEIYQWLLRQSGFKVSETGYFVYVNGKKDRKAFDGKLEFDITVIAYKGSDKWIEKILTDIKKCLMGELPKPGMECEYCAYRKTAAEASFKLGDIPKINKKKETKNLKTEGKKEGLTHQQSMW